MGQYHSLVNLTKKQVVNHYPLGLGGKLLEQTGTVVSMGDVLYLLLACSNGRGGGDFRADSPLIGSWAGDQIAVLGDYCEDGDIPGVKGLPEVYEDACNARYADREDIDTEDANGWVDITQELIPVIEKEFDIKFGTGDGWVDRKLGKSWGSLADNG